MDHENTIEALGLHRRPKLIRSAHSTYTVSVISTCRMLLFTPSTHAAVLRLLQLMTQRAIVARAAQSRS